MEVVLVMVTAWTMLQGFEGSLIWAIFGGLWLDLASAAPFGTMAMALALTAYLLGQIGTGLVRTNPLLPVMAAPVATVTFNGIVVLVLETFGWQLDWTQILTEVILPLCLLNTVVMIPIYGLLYGIHSRIAREINW